MFGDKKREEDLQIRRRNIWGAVLKESLNNPVDVPIELVISKADAVLAAYDRNFNPEDK